MDRGGIVRAQGARSQGEPKQMTPKADVEVEKCVGFLLAFPSYLVPPIRQTSAISVFARNLGNVALLVGVDPYWWARQNSTGMELCPLSRKLLIWMDTGHLVKSYFHLY